MARAPTSGSPVVEGVSGPPVKLRRIFNKHVEKPSICSLWIEIGGCPSNLWMGPSSPLDQPFDSAALGNRESLRLGLRLTVPLLSRIVILTMSYQSYHIMGETGRCGKHEHEHVHPPLTVAAHSQPDLFF